MKNLLYFFVIIASGATAYTLDVSHVTSPQVYWLIGSIGGGLGAMTLCEFNE